MGTRENRRELVGFFRNIDNTMRNFDEIVALWKDAGIDIDNNLSFMCGSGWRAARSLNVCKCLWTKGFFSL